MTILETHDLAIGYDAPRRPRVVVAEHIDLKLSAGQLVCLLGPNGAGKSTLMRTIAKMQAPLAGRITLTGHDLARLPTRQLARLLSVVLTDRPNVGLLNGYALVALGRHPYTDWTGRLSRYDEAVIRWAVDAVNASDLAARPVSELSDGQRQKLMIARALAQESRLILLDEPTAFLDLPRRAEMMHLLRHLAIETGRAILLSTHDLDLALRSADTLWLMSGGRVRVGTPEDLVLDGTFEDAFRGEGVTFDRKTGAFNMIRKHGRTVVIHGQGVLRMWTYRAMTRAGYTVQDSAVADHNALEIIIHDDGDHPLWHVNHAGTTHTCASIETLLSTIARLNTNASAQSHTQR